MDGLEAVQSFGRENEIRMQSHNLFQTWVDRAADLGLFPCVRGVIAVVGVSDEAILQTERVDGFRQTRRERHDAADRLGNTNRAADFVRNFPEGWGCGRDRRSALRTRQRRAGQQGHGCGGDGASGAQAGEFFHKSPLTQGISLHQQKSPTRHLGASGIALSREERGPMRHGRVAWLTAFQPITVAGPRPIHTAFPASFACKLNFECMPRRMECQCTTENGTTENGVTEEMPPVFSGSSSWACAFPQVRAGLPANPQGDKAHSRKCSWTA